jgi:hypothetical protein
MATSPHTHPELYRSIILGGTASPGVVTLSNGDRTHEWDEQKPKGQVGCVTVNKGPKNGKFHRFILSSRRDGRCGVGLVRGADLVDCGRAQAQGIERLPP